MLVAYVLGKLGLLLARARRPPCVLNDELVDRFEEWQRARRTGKYVREQIKKLRWWAEQLRGLDLRCVSLNEHIVPALDRAGGRAPRIAALKRLCSWLVYERHEMDARENPTLGLRCIQSTPEQWRHDKAVPRRTVLRCRKLLPKCYRDGLDVLMGTGWHVTELERFAGAGELLPRAPSAPKEVAGELQVRRKSGAIRRTQVSAAVLRSARRVRGRGGICISRLSKAIRAACDQLGVERWGPGQMRHTVATWAMEHGEDPAKVSGYLEHDDKRTTRRFYAVHVAPRKVATLL